MYSREFLKQRRFYMARLDGDVTGDGVLLRLHPGGQSDSSEVHAINYPELVHSPANVGDAG